MKSSKRSLFGTLEARFLLALITIGIVPFILVTALMVTSQSRALRAQANRELTQQSKLLAEELNIYIRELQADASMIASLEDIQSMDAAVQTRLLTDIHQGLPRYGQLAVANLEGQLIAASRPMELVSIEGVTSFRRAAGGVQSWVLDPGLFDKSKTFMHKHTPI